MTIEVSALAEMSAADPERLGRIYRRRGAFGHACDSCPPPDRD